MSRLSLLFIVLLLTMTLMARAAAVEPKSEKAASEAERARHLVRARAVAGSALDRLVVRVQDVLPQRRPGPRRVTSFSDRRESQRRAAVAIAEGRFKDQIVPVTIPQRKGDSLVADLDEHPRPGTTAESLARLKPAFRDGGSVTAGNSSGINDAGAALVVMTSARAQELGVTPQLEWVADAVAGIAPEIMGVAPIFAVQNLLKKAGMTINDIDLMELNEAFAAQAVAVIRELEIDPEKVNPNGGAIALGHPVGATGAILTVKLAYELKRRQAEWGIVTMCIGGGQGIATLFRNLN